MVYIILLWMYRMLQLRELCCRCPFIFWLCSPTRKFWKEVLELIVKMTAESYSYFVGGFWEIEATWKIWKWGLASLWPPIQVQLLLGRAMKLLPTFPTQEDLEAWVNVKINLEEKMQNNAVINKDLLESNPVRDPQGFWTVRFWESKLHQIPRCEIHWKTKCLEMYNGGGRFHYW